VIKKINIIFTNPIRDPFPDFLRGIALILMIQVHLTEVILISKPEYLFFEKLSYLMGGIPAAPVFLILMGYFQGISKANLKKEIIRGIQLIALGFALNFCMNATLLYKIITGEFNLVPWKYILGVDILFIAGLAFIFIGFIKRFLSRIYLQVVLLIIVFIVQFLTGELKVEGDLLLYSFSFLFRVSDWSYFPFIPWIAYPVSGLILSHKKLIKAFEEFKLPTWSFVLLITFLLITLNYALEVSSNLKSYYNFGFTFYVWSLIFLILWGYLLKNIQSKFTDSLIIKYIRWLGKNVTVVYFFQWILIGNIGTNLYKSIHFQDYLIIFLLILFITSICTYLYNLSKIN